MEKITIPYLENQYKEKLQKKKEGMKIPLSEKFHKPQIFWNNYNELQRMKTATNFFPSSNKVLSKPNIPPLNIHRDISMPQINQNNNGLQNNIQSKTAYGNFNFQPQQNTQMYQYQKLNNQGNVPLQGNNNQQIFTRQLEMA